MTARNWLMQIGAATALALLGAGNALAERLTFGESAAVEFAPALGQTFAVPILLQEEASVVLLIHTPDGEPIRQIAAADRLPAGKHELVWDGKDRIGVVVPNEAYVPVLEARFADGTTETVDPRDTSGGEILDEVPVRTAGNDIEFRLSVPARVLLRVGIDGGPMLHELASWAPRSPGVNVQRWDGYDASGKVRIAGRDRLRVLVAAFALPKHSIIVSGTRVPVYLEYASGIPESGRADQESESLPLSGPLSRGDQRISRFHYQSRAMSRPPTVELSFTNGVTTAERDGGPSFTAVGPMTIRVDVPPEDRWLLQRSQYEIAFFVDDEFVSEEESGYVPLTWIYDPSGLAPGRHLLTVNLSGFQGQVGVATVAFDVPGADE